jgi:hypothetical protein
MCAWVADSWAAGAGEDVLVVFWLMWTPEIRLAAAGMRLAGFLELYDPTYEPPETFPGAGSEAASARSKR